MGSSWGRQNLTIQKPHNCWSTVMVAAVRSDLLGSCPDVTVCDVRCSGRWVDSS